MTDRPAEAPARKPSGTAAHLPALDGVRAVAVLLVLLFHYEVRRWPWFGMLGQRVKYAIDFGWSGVDLFFVLSGFLITGILWSSRERPHYFRNFYARRTLRIFPVYYVFLIVIFIVLPAIFGGKGLGPATPLSTQMWYWTYTCNVLLAVWGWGAMAAYTPHFWSLAVEEQFYLVWPSVMRWVTLRGALAVCTGAIVVAFAFRCWLVLAHGNVTAAWALTPARMDALAVGALLALLARTPKGLEPLTRHAGWLMAAGFTAVVALLLWRGTYADTDRGMATIGYSVVAFAWGTFLVGALSGGHLTRVLRNPVLQWIGRRSYALYIFHHPIMTALDKDGFTINFLLGVFHHEVFAHLAFLVVNAGLSLLAAELSWRLLESRMLKLKDRFAS